VDGKYLVTGKRVSAFSDIEEEQVQLAHKVPFALEGTLRERGALIENSTPW